MLGELLTQAGRDCWDLRPYLETFLQSDGERVQALQELALTLPLQEKVAHALYYRPVDDNNPPCLWLFQDGLSEDLFQEWHNQLSKQAQLELSQGESRPPSFGQEPWVLIKKSHSPLARGVTDLVGMTPGPANTLYGGPSPAAATLLGGLTGAGVGYLGGSLAENLSDSWLGQRFRPGRLRKTLALLGGAVGAAPGLGWGYLNATKLGPAGLFSSYPHPPAAPFEPETTIPPGPIPDWNTPKGEEKSVSDDSWKRASAAARELFPHWLEGPLQKAASLLPGGSDLDAPIPVDAFGNVVWSASDPFTPMATRAATMGLVDAASMSRGNSPFVTPGDVARIGIGMGSGYLAGRLVGKTLGALAGLSPDSQRSLQQAGTWAGLLKTVIPLAFQG